MNTTNEHDKRRTFRVEKRCFVHQSWPQQSIHQFILRINVVFQNLHNVHLRHHRATCFHGVLPCFFFGVAFLGHLHFGQRHDLGPVTMVKMVPPQLNLQGRVPFEFVFFRFMVNVGRFRRNGDHLHLYSCRPSFGRSCAKNHTDLFGHLVPFFVLRPPTQPHDEPKHRDHRHHKKGHDQHHQLFLKKQPSHALHGRPSDLVRVVAVRVEDVVPRVPQDPKGREQGLHHGRPLQGEGRRQRHQLHVVEGDLLHGLRQVNGGDPDGVGVHQGRLQKQIQHGTDTDDAGKDGNSLHEFARAGVAIRVPTGGGGWNNNNNNNNNNKR